MNRITLLAGFLFSTALGSTALSQTWTALQTPCPSDANNPMLLFDGSLLVQGGDTNQWYRYYPDQFGGYQDGTWVALPSTGSYAPLYYASSILPDGRVFIEGGEYNGAGAGFTNEGVIFDPSSNTFSTLQPPKGWTQIGDMASVVLPNGKILVQQPITNGGALFDGTTNSFTVPYGSGKDYNDEEGLTLLPNGKIFTVSCWTANATYLFDPSTQLWTRGADTPYNIVDTADAEMGPQVVRPDGTVICFGGNGSNAIYHPTTNSWTAAPAFPTSGGTQLECADAGAVLLPNGNVLVQTGPGYTGSGAKYFEFDGTAMNAVPDAPNAAQQPGFTGNFLMLPTGQAFYTAQDSRVYLYTPKGSYLKSWAPTITTAPTLVKIGSKYQLTGTQLTGLSGCSAYGDDEQNETNYPLIRITNNSTGHVFYCIQSGLNTHAIATGNTPESAYFTVPTGIELGASTLQVVTNGIPSSSRAITVAPPVAPSSVSVYQGNPAGGSLSSILAQDGTFFNVNSVTAPAGQVAAIEVDYNFPTTAINGYTIQTIAKAVAGVTGQVYAYNYTTNQFVIVNSFNMSSSDSTTISTLTTNGSQFISSTGQARFIFRGVLPPHVSPGNFTLGLDLLAATVR